MISLYLVRHGIAIDLADSKGASDELRPLTGKGRRRFRKAARAFGKLAGKVDLILTSPLVRAVQTAEILAGEVKHGEVAVLEELASGGVAALLAAVAKRAGTGKSVALVGHEPQLSSILTALAHLGPEESSKLDFRKGAIVRLDVSGLPDAKTVQPRWWVKPRSGARAKGLPLQKPPPTARPARAVKRGKAGNAKKAGTNEAAGKGSPPARPRAAKRARAAKAAEADRAALPRPVPRRAATPRAQSFMGSPRHQGGTAQTSPAQPAPAPAPSRPAEPVVPPHDGSGSGPAQE
jgi:phosphohistidine phosphatase